MKLFEYKPGINYLTMQKDKNNSTMIRNQNADTYRMPDRITNRFKR